MKTYLVKVQYQGDDRCELNYRAYSNKDENNVEDAIVLSDDWCDLEQECINEFEEYFDDDKYASCVVEDVTEDKDLINSSWFQGLGILLDERDKITRWLLSVSHVQHLDSYICYCVEDPTTLILTHPKYSDVYNELVNELYDSFSYLYDDNEEYDDSEDSEQEKFNTFCENLSFEAYEDIEDDDERFSILIDERNEK